MMNNRRRNPAIISLGRPKDLAKALILSTIGFPLDLVSSDISPSFT
jgi:hypothetical protein